MKKSNQPTKEIAFNVPLPTYYLMKSYAKKLGIKLPSLMYQRVTMKRLPRVILSSNQDYQNLYHALASINLELSHLAETEDSMYANCAKALEIRALHSNKQRHFSKHAINQAISNQSGYERQLQAYLGYHKKILSPKLKALTNSVLKLEHRIHVIFH